MELRPGMRVRLWSRWGLPEAIKEAPYAEDVFVCVDDTEVEGRLLGKVYTLESATSFRGQEVWALKSEPGVFISHYWIAEVIRPRCECGAQSIGSHLHSDWCPSYTRDQIYKKDDKYDDYSI